MPIIYSEQIEKNAIWGVWEIKENEISLMSILNGKIAIEKLDTITHSQKRIEWLGARALVCELAERFKESVSEIANDNLGKPYLKNQPLHLSISHSKKYAVAILHRHSSVGIDIELSSQRVLNNIHRLCSEEEMLDIGNDIQKATKAWCAKEALYKYYGEKKLNFKKNIFLYISQNQIEGKIIINNLEKTPKLFSKSWKDYMIVYCFDAEAENQ
ncbi:MAG: 4'-phosphopantetheinyl transferase superfamily protein [Thermoflexibacter sp.]